MTSTQKTHIALAAIAVTLVVSGGVAWIYDLHEIGPRLIRSWGWAAIVGYTLLIMVLGGLGVPPVIFMVPTAVFWPLPMAIIMSFTGGLGAASTGFFLSRTCLRETVEPKIPEKISQYEHRLETHGFSTVLVMRLLFYLFPPINWMLGISAIPFRIFMAGTLIGMIPGTLVYVLTGRGVFGFIAELGTVTQISLLSLGGIGLLLWFRWATASETPIS